jgi:putative tryptophan/tyrosine transport system substrate-binding protein
MSGIKRRDFIALLGGAAAAWPLAARAQQPVVPVVGFTHILSPENVPHFVPAFRQGLKEQGFVEGQNLEVVYHWAHGQYDRLAELAADLVRRQVAVIAAMGGSPSPQVAMRASQTIPIVFATNGDPVKEGLVASLNRPGRNATGVTIFGPAAVAKRLQLLHELVPQAVLVAYLMNPNNPNAEFELGIAQEAAHSLGADFHVFHASSESEIESAFTKMSQQQVRALVGASDTFFTWRRDQIISLAAHHRIPAIYYLREFAQSGGLMAYGNSIPDAYRVAGVYVGRILKGEKPGDLPVVQSTRFEFVINMKTASTLGIEVPNSMQLLADEVIE